MIHLTARAVEWLKNGGNMPESSYRSDRGVRACDGHVPSKAMMKYDGWTRVEDVRAMVRGWTYAYINNVPRLIETPTCEKCAVMLDGLLEAFQAKARESV